MNETSVSLYPRNYLEVTEKIKLYFVNKNNLNEVNKLVKELCECKLLIISSEKNNSTLERKYFFYIGKYVVTFKESNKNNLLCHVLSENEASWRRRKLFGERLFTIIPSGHIYSIYNNNLYPATLDSDWNMFGQSCRRFFDSLEKYFDSEEEDSTNQNERIWPSSRFISKIINPFKNYTEKEDWVERYKQSQGEGFIYLYREFFRKNDIGAIYKFFVSSDDVDSENPLFKIGDRITVVDIMRDSGSICTGVLVDIDNESEDKIIFDLSFNYQLNDKDIPMSGKLVMGINVTQTSVRRKVIKSMELGLVESKYMYRTFDKYLTKGYEEIPKDLKEFLAEKIASKYPPNQMQLEAIIKGILTEDLLLVLGPPGTGKTTVISYWVEYFVRKGQRVLISSQNNAAVDNVLERFGKIAETVRLGNEEKVKESCKPYLPQNKISVMCEHFDRNNKRVQTDFDRNEQEIEKYKERLREFLSLMHDYIVKSETVEAYTKTIKSMIESLNIVYNNAVSVDNELKNSLDSKAQKERYLNDYESRSKVVRFFRYLFMKRVRKRLANDIERIKQLNMECKDHVNKYNRLSKDLRDYVISRREEKISEQYLEVKARFTEYVKGTENPEYSLRLFGELNELYKNVEFSDNLEKNRALIQLELKKVSELETTIEKTKVILAEWNEMVNNKRNDVMQNVLLETSQVVGATCIGINTNRIFSNVKFDVAIVDEAGQIQIHNALIPMTRAPKNLLLGDYKQIPPCADETVVAACKAEGVDTKLLDMSFFEFVFGELRSNIIKDLEHKGLDKSYLVKPVLIDYNPESTKGYVPDDVEDMISRVVSDSKKIVNLNKQFRMPGNISDVISEWFYENNYFSSYDMNEFTPLLPTTNKPLVIISTSKSNGRIENKPQNKMGYQNRYEAQIVANIVAEVIGNYHEESRAKILKEIENNIGIISAYGAQVKLIKEYLENKELGIMKSQINSMVASLDSFQGQERPLIIYSLTRSSINKAREVGRIGFLKELRRLNVAFTRCQKQLVVIGDIDYLTNCMYVDGLQEHEKNLPCSNTKEDEIIRKEIIEQCSECSAICERRFARFMKLLMQHVNNGSGIIIDSKRYEEKNYYE